MPSERAIQMLSEGEFQNKDFPKRIIKTESKKTFSGKNQKSDHKFIELTLLICSSRKFVPYLLIFNDCVLLENMQQLTQGLL